MNKRQLLELTKVNLRYANPQITDKARKKGKNGKKLTRYLLNQFLLSGFLFLVIYGMVMGFMDFSQMPGFFTYYVALFGILGFSQGISTIYNVFFESQDLPAYLPLPFRQTEIFMAKILVVTLTVVPFVFPLFVLFLLTGVRSGIFIPIVVLSSIVLFGLFLIIIFSICSLIVFGLTRTRFFKQHKKLVISLLLGASMVVAVVGILLMNQTSSYDTTVLDRKAISFLMPVFYAASTPFVMSGWLSYLGIIAVAIVLLLLLNYLILPKFYEQVTEAAPNNGSVKRKHKKNQNLRQLLFGYNSQLVKDPNLIMQVLSTSLMTPLIFIVTFAITGIFDLSNLGLQFIGVTFFAGIALATLTVNQTSFISSLISLDQENFLFVRSLPLSMKTYLWEKFLFGLILQTGLTGIITVIAGVVFRLPLLLLLSFIIGALYGAFLLCLRYYARDYKLLLLNWTNVNQLFTRGSGSIGLVFGMMLAMILSVALIAGYAFAATILPFWPLNLPVFLGLVIIASVWCVYYKKNFWQKF